MQTYQENRETGKRPEKKNGTKNNIGKNTWSDVGEMGFGHLVTGAFLKREKVLEGKISDDGGGGGGEQQVPSIGFSTLTTEGAGGRGGENKSPECGSETNLFVLKTEETQRLAW